MDSQFRVSTGRPGLSFFKYEADKEEWALERWDRWPYLAVPTDLGSDALWGYPCLAQYTTKLARLRSLFVPCAELQASSSHPGPCASAAGIFLLFSSFSFVYSSSTGFTPLGLRHATRQPNSTAFSLGETMAVVDAREVNSTASSLGESVPYVDAPPPRK